MAVLKILAIKLRSLGDTVLMTAPLIELFKKYPQSQMDAVILDSWSPLLENMPGIHEIIGFDRPQDRLARTRALVRLAFSLRKKKYDWVINFHASPSSATLAFATGAQTRSIHFHGHRHKNRYSTVQIPGKGTLKPIIERDMDTLRALGMHVPAGRLPHITLHSTETEVTRDYLNKLGMQDPILGISLGASRPTKIWPIERFAALAIEWCQQTNGSVFTVAGPDEEHLIQEFLKWVDEHLRITRIEPKVRAEIRMRIAAAHQLSIRKLAAVLSQVSVLAGNDSGPKHLAVAVNTPTVTLFGPEHPFEWHPYPENRHPYLFIESLSCRRDAEPGMPPWCGLVACKLEEHKCMRQIGVESVLTHCVQVAK